MVTGMVRSVMRSVMFFAAALLAVGGPLHTAQFPLADPSRTETKHLTLTTSTSAQAVAPGERLSLYVDVSPKPKMHVYAPDQTEYIPIELKVNPATSFKAQVIQYPAAEQFFFAPLKETQRVYSKPFRITLPIVLAQNAASAPLTIKGIVRYQACDDAICYLPQTVGVSWKITVKK
jgi:DsbC/DsbD-like thiol-disulfide interchange protein